MNDDPASGVPRTRAPVNRAVERKVILITRRTRYEELVTRHHTAEQARFYVEHLGADFEDYVAEHETYSRALTGLRRTLEQHGRYQVIERSFVSNFVFAAGDVVVTLGQDGLVANTLKYLDGQPLIGLNPDPARWDGALAVHEVEQFDALLPAVLAGEPAIREVTMAEAALPDGQVMRAVNDLFIGPRSHTSARYEIQLDQHREVQSSSGLIVSTGLGSTGWMRSVMTGAVGVVAGLARQQVRWAFEPKPWDWPALAFAVREPFPSRSSQAELVYGQVPAGKSLTLTSRMAEQGVIFSDGIESDYLEFNAGTRAEIRVAERVGRVVA